MGAKVQAADSSASETPGWLQGLAPEQCHQQALQRALVGFLALMVAWERIHEGSGSSAATSLTNALVWLTTLYLPALVSDPGANDAGNPAMTQVAVGGLVGTLCGFHCALGHLGGNPAALTKVWMALALPFGVLFLGHLAGVMRDQSRLLLRLGALHLGGLMALTLILGAC